MTEMEIRAAIKFGREAIEEYKKNGEQVPAFLYDRIIELYEKLTEEK